MSSDRGDEIKLLIRDISAASNLVSKSRGTSIKPTVDNLASLSYEFGLEASAVHDVLTIIVSPGHLDQASLNTLLRSLYPVTKVSQQDILLVISALGHGKLKPSLSLQASLLRWLIMVYHILEVPALLSQAYAMLFNLLDTAAIRPQLAHVLALITRRKHVRPFRIQNLLNLSRQTGNDPCLVGLLRVFKDYYPEIIVGEAVRGKASAFKHPDTAWREKLDALQAAHLQQVQEQASGPRDGFRVNKPVSRIQRSKVIPTVHTTHANEESVTLEEVENVKAFVEKMDQLELPNQLIAVLADPLLQKLLILRPDTESHQRVANWLNSVLQEVVDGETDEATLWELLAVVEDFVVQTKTLPALVLNFFARFFPLWSGSGNRSCIYAILAYSPFLDFTTLYEHIFKPLESAVIDNRVESQFDLLQLYTDLLHHWAGILKSSDVIPQHTAKSISALVEHTSSLALTLIQTSPSAETQSAVLALYEQALDLVLDKRLVRYVRLELPQPSLVYILFLSNSLATNSRLCYLLARYRAIFAIIFEDPKKSGPAGAIINASSYPRPYIGIYNSYITDICNCYWRSKAFDNTGNSANGLGVPATTIKALTVYITKVDRTFSFESILSLSYSPATCLQSLRLVRAIEDKDVARDDSIETRHAGPVTINSLNKLRTSGGINIGFQAYQVEVLQALNRLGLNGVGDLLTNAIPKVKTAMEGKSRAEPTPS